MTDRKTATCTCGEPKSPEAEQCQTCHMDDVHEGTRQRHAKNRRLKAALRWAKRVMDGDPISIRPGADMSKDEFKAALCAAIEKVKARCL